MSRPTIVIALVTLGVSLSACTDEIADDQRNHTPTITVEEPESFADDQHNHTPTITVEEPESLSDGEVSYEEWSNNRLASMQSLEALEALELISVGEMVVDAPKGAHNCYGPCEDDPVDREWMVEHAWQTERLAMLVDFAEDAMVDAPESIACLIIMAIVCPDSTIL